MAAVSVNGPSAGFGLGSSGVAGLLQPSPLDAYSAASLHQGQAAGTDGLVVQELIPPQPGRVDLTVPWLGFVRLDVPPLAVVLPSRHFFGEPGQTVPQPGRP
jgi:hypothetical protein